MTSIERGPLTTAAIQQIVASRAEVILDDPLVAAWIERAGDGDQRDRRACSLVVSAANFYHNAHQPRRTPAEHTKHYEQFADELFRLAKALGADLAPALQRHAHALELAATDARQLAQSPEMWTHSRPHHANAALNDFAREMTGWWELTTGKPQFELTATIIAILFDLEGGIKAQTVETICRRHRRPASSS